MFFGKHLGESKELKPRLDSDNPAGSGKRKVVALNLGETAPRRLPTCLETFLVVITGRKAATGIEWVAARAVTKHATVYRTAPYSKGLSAPSVNSAELEKP